MKKTFKSALSLMLSILVVFGTLVLGMTAFAEGEEPTHDCEKEGHDYENYVANDPYSTSEDYKNFTHNATCKYCGEEATFYCNLTVGWAHIDGCRHYIACADCDRKYKLGNCRDEDINFKDSNGMLTTDGLCDICKAELSHRYQKVSSTPADCVTPGYDKYMCLNCNEEYTELVNPPVGHNWTSVIAENNPTFSYDEEKYMWCKATFSCTRGCGEKLEYTVWADSGDTDNIVEIVEKRDATCTEAGYVKLRAKFKINNISSEGWAPVSGESGQFIAENEYNVVIPALGHTRGGVVESKTPSCTEDGFVTYSCTRCHETYTDTVGKLGHSYSDYVSNGDATCEHDGTQTRRCSRCFGEETIADPGTALGHDLGDPVQVEGEPATCSKAGYYYNVFNCTRCSKELDKVRVDVEPTGLHTDSDGDGFCDVCNIETEHDYRKVSNNPARCTSAPSDVYRCRVCGDTKTVITGIELGHLWPSKNAEKDEKFITYSYDEDNFQSCTLTIRCKRPECNQSLTYTVYEEANEFGVIAYKGIAEADCVNGSGTKYTATFNVPNLDGTTTEYTYDIVIPDGLEEAKGHTYGTPVVTTEPKCNEVGKQKSVCSECGYELITDVPATGHVWGEAVESVAPTCTGKGAKVSTCTKCGETKTEAIDALGHDFSVFVSGVQATCTTPGSGTYKCSRCEATKTGEIAALGHDYNVLDEATCTEDGTEKCSKCEDRRIIPAIGHVDFDGDGICDKCSAVTLTSMILSIDLPKTKNVNYGDILVLTAKISTKQVPSGYKVVWTANYPSAVILTPSSDGLTCEAKVIGVGTDEDGNKDDTIVVTATLLKGDNTEARNLNGVIHGTVSFKAKIGIYEKILNFFKTILFFLNRRVY